MPIAYTLSNGKLLVGIDKKGQTSDFYFPNNEHNLLGAGLLNQIGIRIDTRFEWLSSWEIRFLGLNLNELTFTHPDHQLEIKISDQLLNSTSTHKRTLLVTNNSQNSRNITLYFNQQFQFPSFKSDTAYFEPVSNTVVHFGQGLCVVTALGSTKGNFTQYSVGLKGLEGMQGAFKDAESGQMSNNPIEHGKVDSVISIDLDLKPGELISLDYCNSAGTEIPATIQAAVAGLKQQHETNLYISDDIETKMRVAGLGQGAIDLYSRSVSEIVNHTGTNGAIISSSDSSLMVEGRGRYSYVWPRDASTIAQALTVSGRLDLARDFFHWIADRVMQDGSFWHRYNPDGSLGSTWHPKIINGQFVNQNQVDQTGAVLFSLYEYFDYTYDLELLETIFERFIKPASIYLQAQLNPILELNAPSFDLWEAKYGIHTYSLAASLGGLLAGSKLAKAVSQPEFGSEWKRSAESVMAAIKPHLFSEENRFFIKGVNSVGDKAEVDITRDISSLFGIYKYKLFDYNSREIKESVVTTKNQLMNPMSVGGMIRYDNDKFFAESQGSNPWVICSMWLAQIEMDQANNQAELEETASWIEWAVSRASASGMLAEQYHPESGKAISIEPLVWSHAEYIIAVHKYLNRFADLKDLN